MYTCVCECFIECWDTIYLRTCTHGFFKFNNHHTQACTHTHTCTHLPTRVCTHIQSKEDKSLLQCSAIYSGYVDVVCLLH